MRGTKVRFTLLAAALGISLVLAPCIGPALAADSTSSSLDITSAYQLDHTMYCFAEPRVSETELSGVTVSSVYANSIGKEEETLVKVGDTGLPVHYQLLIDTSDSMPNYKSRIRSFVSGLTPEESQEFRISIAGVGEEFQILGESLTEAGQVEEVIKGLRFEQKTSDLSGGMVDGLCYLTNAPRKPGEVCCLILITDGIAYVYGSETDQTLLEDRAKAAKQMIEASSDVIVHSVCLQKWEVATQAAVSTGTGIHTQPKTDREATQAGRVIAKFTDGLHALAFPLSTTERVFSAQLCLKYPLTSEDAGATGDIGALPASKDGLQKQTIEFISIGQVRNLSYSNFTPEEIGVHLETPVPAASKEEGVPAEVTETPGTEDGSLNEIRPGIEDTKPTAIDKNDSDSEGSGEPSLRNPPNWLPIVLICVVLLTAALLVAFRRKKRKAPAASEHRGGPDGWVRLELLAGSIRGEQTEYPLEKELILGSDPSCDIVLSGVSTLGLSARIFLENGVVMLEDLNTESATSIGGMRIYAPNRLRNGDIVSIGPVRFRVELLKSR